MWGQCGWYITTNSELFVLVMMVIQMVSIYSYVLMCENLFCQNC